jgi:hypothetical protein
MAKNQTSFQPGHKQIEGSGWAGKRKGIRDMLKKVLPQHEMIALWEYFLYGKEKNTHKITVIPKEIKFEAFKMALHYLYGRPPREPIEQEDRAIGGGPQFDVSAVPTRHDPIM